MVLRALALPALLAALACGAAGAGQSGAAEGEGQVLDFAVRDGDELHLRFGDPVRLGLPGGTAAAEALGLRWQILRGHLWLRLQRDLAEPLRLGLKSGDDFRVLQLRPLQKPRPARRRELRLDGVAGRSAESFGEGEVLQLVRWALHWELGERESPRQDIHGLSLAALPGGEPPRLLRCPKDSVGCVQLRPQLLRLWEYSGVSGGRLQAWVWKLGTEGAPAWNWTWLRGSWMGGSLTDSGWRREFSDLALGPHSTLLVLLRELW